MKTFSLVVMLVVIVLALGFGGVARTAVASTDTWEVDCQLTQAQLALGDEGAAALIYAWNPQWVGTPGAPDAYITPTLSEYLAWYGFIC
jgi:hypothetical protein